MEERHLNVAQLSRRWGLAPKTLDRWRQRGIGPHFLKIGGHVIYRLSDVLAYEDERVHQITDKDPGEPLTGNDAQAA